MTMLIAAGASWLCAAAVLLLGQTWSRAWLAVAVVAATTAVPVVVHSVHRHRRGGLWQPPLPAALLAVAAAMLSAGVGVNAVTTGPIAQASQSAAVITVDAQVQSDVRVLSPRPNRPSVAAVELQVTTVRVHHQSWRCATRVLLMMSPAQASHVSWGVEIRVVARARGAHRGQRVAAVLTALETPTVTAIAPAWARAAQKWRTGLRAAAGEGEAAALLPALAIGDTSREPQNLIDDMRTSGLSHLSAVSGANVSIVLATVTVLGLLLGLRGWLLGVMLLLALAWFVVVARPSPSVVRAAAMGVISVVPLIVGWRRTRGGVNALYALSLGSCVLVVLDPWLALSWGYALSFFATLGLVIGAGPLQRWLNTHVDVMGEWVRRVRVTGIRPLGVRIRNEQFSPTSDGNEKSTLVDATPAHSESAGSEMSPPALASRIRNAARRWFIGALAVSVCAQVAVAPVLLLMGAQLSWVSLPANLLAEAAVAPATISGLTASAAAQFSPTAAHLIARPGVLATQWISYVAHGSARIARDHPLQFESLLQHLPFVHSGFPADTQVVLCDVGQGTALVIPLGNGSAIVDDVGPDAQKIDGCLKRAGVTSIALLILSHFHADHVSGLSGALEHRTLGRVLISPLAQPSEGVNLVQQQLLEHSASAEITSSGARYAVGNAVVEVVSPSFVMTGVESPPNDNCVSVVITVDVSWRASPLRILAPCDLEYAGQESVLASHSTMSGNFDIALVPHHGSAKQLEAFAMWAKPHIALIPVGAHNDYGHPAEIAVKLWGNHGRTRLGRTDTEGDLVVHACAQQVCLTR